MDDRDAVVLRVPLPPALARRVGRLADIAGVDEVAVVRHALTQAITAMELAVGATHHLRACPRCGAAPDVTEVDGVALCACQACGGIWLDRPAATRLTQSASAEVEAFARRLTQRARERVPTREMLACPVCEAPMERAERGPAGTIDRCSEHGTFLDAGELDAMIPLLRQRLANEGALDQARLDEDAERMREMVASVAAAAEARGRRRGY